MNKNQLAGRLLFGGGIAELLIAMLHFLMPFSIGQASEISGLPVAYRNYVSHATIAIGLCMVCLGLLSITSHRKHQKEI
jgi:hypothetical protein